MDDNKSFRRLVVLMLQQKPGFQVIGEAADGLDGVQKAENLKPDLVLLDIGLPKLNGIRASILIRKCSPGSKIVFLTEQCDRDVVHAALDTGASAYVHKSHAGRELDAAVEAALRGSQFVSSSLRVPFLDYFAA